MPFASAAAKDRIDKVGAFLHRGKRRFFRFEAFHQYAAKIAVRLLLACQMPARAVEVIILLAQLCFALRVDIANILYVRL